MKRELPLAPLDQMIGIVRRFAPDDERCGTAIPFLSLLRSSRPTPVTRKLRFAYPAPDAGVVPRTEYDPFRPHCGLDVRA